MNYNEQVRMFKHLIPIGPKSISELVEMLEAKADIKEIAPNELPGYARQTAIYNASHCILNEDLQVKPDNMLLLAFQIIQNEKSSYYYSDDIMGDDFIYVVFEKHTEYMWSNSQKLFLELELARGVSQHEFDTEGILFRSLVAHLASDYCLKNGIEF
ncbi:MAG TPA: hypothetical protein DCZ10_09885 [Pelotomaculum sp.]|nr:hypothetical protein [Pelotomaculum sp.]